MQKKGQVGVGAFIMVFVAIIAGLVLYQAIVSNIGASTTTVTATDAAYTAPSAKGGIIDITGQEYISGITVINATDGTTITGNFSIGEGVSSVTGLKRVQLTLLNETWASKSIKLNYTYGPEGYVEDSGARSIYILVAIFAALGIVVVALYPTFKNNILGG